MKGCDGSDGAGKGVIGSNGMGRDGNKKLWKGRIWKKRDAIGLEKELNERLGWDRMGWKWKGGRKWMRWDEK